METVTGRVRLEAFTDDCKRAVPKTLGRLPSVPRHAITTCAAAAIALFASLPGLAQQGTWTARTSMPTPRAGMAAGAIDGILYLAGGYGCPHPPDPGGPCDVTAGYKPKADAWSARAPLPSPSRSDACAAVVDEDLYVIGGSTFSGATAVVQAYDPKTDSWVTKAPLPEARSACAAGVIDRVLYVAGGFGPTFVESGFVRATLWAYDPKADTWTVKAPMPAPIAQAAAGVINGIFYVAGGGPPQGSSIGISAALFAYDPAADTWTLEPPMPTPRAFAAGTVLDGKLYVVGGVAFNSPSGYTSVEIYDPTTRTWSTGPTLPTARFDLGAGVAEDALYALGGQGPSPYLVLAVNEAFTPFEMVSIDIKPGDRTNTINLGSHGVVPVAILGSATFDPMTVDPTTVTLAGAHVASRGGDARVAGQPRLNADRVPSPQSQVPALMTGQSDVNGDGYPDLLVYFRTQDLTALQQTVAAMSSSPQAGGSPVGTPALQQEAVLYGTTYSGQRIRGSDTIRIVPAVQASPRAFPRGRTAVASRQ